MTRFSRRLRLLFCFTKNSAYCNNYKKMEEKIMIKKAKKCCLLTVGALGLAAVIAAAVVYKKEDIAFDEWCKSRK